MHWKKLTVSTTEITEMITDCMQVVYLGCRFIESVADSLLIFCFDVRRKWRGKVMGHVKIAYWE